MATIDHFSEEGQIFVKKLKKILIPYKDLSEEQKSYKDIEKEMLLPLRCDEHLTKEFHVIYVATKRLISFYFGKRKFYNVFRPVLDRIEFEKLTKDYLQILHDRGVDMDQVRKRYEGYIQEVHTLMANFDARQKKRFERTFINNPFSENSKGKSGIPSDSIYHHILVLDDLKLKIPVYGIKVFSGKFTQLANERGIKLYYNHIKKFRYPLQMFDDCNYVYFIIKFGLISYFIEEYTGLTHKETIFKFYREKTKVDIERGISTPVDTIKLDFPKAYIKRVVEEYKKCYISK